MTKKDYEKAAQIVQKKRKATAKEVENAFVELFRDDNPRFDEERFRFACNREVK